MADLYIKYGGILFPVLAHDEESLNYTLNDFQIRDDDIINLTYPKSGTTWMQEILTLIYNDGNPETSQNVPSWERVPWMEHKTGRGYLENRPSPRLISTHLPVHLAPKSLFKSKAKVIYTARNPKDAFVSLYFYSMSSSYMETPKSFDDFLHQFLNGDVANGSWFDHIRDWLSVKDKIDMLFQTYEELLQDLRGSVVKICQFLGRDLDEKAIDSVVENSKFKSMNENKMSNYSLVPEDVMDLKKSPFLRKGVSGDWRNHFTQEHIELFDATYQEKMKDVKMKFIWD